MTLNKFKEVYYLFTLWKENMCVLSKLTGLTLKGDRMNKSRAIF